MAASTHGPSIRERIWAELDQAVAEAHGALGSSKHGLKNKALGLAIALAILTNPYNPDLDAIREEATRHFTERTH